MPILFFILLLIVPAGLAYFGYPKDASIDALTALFFLNAFAVGWMFRPRLHGRAYQVSLFSYESYAELGVGAGLSALAGALTANGLVSGCFFITAALLIISALRVGPVYGWDTTGK